MRRFILLIIIGLLGVTHINSIEVLIGDGVNTEQHLPIDQNWCSLTQSIYIQEQINLENHLITTLSYYYSGISAWTKESVQIYLGHTALTGFSDIDGWVPIDSLFLVYDDSLSIPSTEGWVDIILDYPFHYNNTDNLVIAFQTNSSNNYPEDVGFLCTEVSPLSSIRYYDTLEGLSFTNPPSGYRSHWLPNIKLTMTELSEEPYLSYTLEDYNWNNVILGAYSAPVTCTLRKIGYGSLNINSINLDQNTDFILIDNNNYPISLDIHGSEVQIIFHPSTTGEHESNLIINDSQNNETIIPFTATSINPIISDFPYHETFSDCDFYEVPEHWTVITNPNENGNLICVSFHPLSFDLHCLKYNNESEDNADYAISPSISNISTKRLRFKTTSYSYLGQLSVGVCSNPNDMTTYEEIQTFSLSNDYYAIEEHYVNLETDNNDNLYFVFKIPPSFPYNSAYIHDIMIDEAPIYPIPRVRPESWEIAETTINNTHEKSFILENYGTGQLILNSVELYQDSGFSLLDEYDYPLTITDQLLPYHLTFNPEIEGIHNASLVFRFQDRSEVIVPINAVVTDPQINDLPYFEDFESVEIGSLPQGWSSYIEQENSPDFVHVTSQAGYESLNSLRMRNSANYPWDIIAITPLLENAHQISVSFKAKGSTSSSQLQIGSILSDNEDVTFTPLDTFDLTLTWDTYEYTFDNSEDPETSMAFKLINNSIANVIIDLDNFVFDRIDTDPHITYNTDLLDFGDTFLNRAGVSEIVIGNNGETPLELEISSPSENLSFEPSQISIPFGASQNIEVTLNPSATGPYSDYFTISSNDVNNPSITINTIANVLPAQAENISIIGTGTSSDYSLPFDANYFYSYSQAIYYPQEIGDVDERISKISWYYNGDSEFGPEEFVIYMGHTDKTRFNDNSDWFPISELQVVYEGTITTTDQEGWIDFDLYVPFDYNQTQNLLVAVKESNQTCHSTSADFYCTPSIFSRGIAYFCDNESPDLANPPSARVVSNAYPNIKLEFNEIPNQPSFRIYPVNNNFLPTPPHGYSLEKTITIKSIGLEDVIISESPILSGENANDFVIMNDLNTYPLVLSYNQTASFEVSFHPTSSGEKNAVIEVTDDSQRIVRTVELHGYANQVDDNDSVQSASLLTLPVEGLNFEIFPTDDVDWYKIPSLVIGDTLSVYCQNEGILLTDLRLKLFGPYSSNPNYIDEDSPNICASSLEYLIPESGNYYLKVVKIDMSKSDKIEAIDKEAYRQTGNLIYNYNLYASSTNANNYQPPTQLETSYFFNFIRLYWQEPSNVDNLLGYHVFRNGDQINEELIPYGTSVYYDRYVTYYGEYTYYLVGVYDNPPGFSPPSETVSIIYHNPGMQLVNDDFEDYPDFTTDLSNWIQWDLDESDTYQFPNTLYPQAGETGSFMVFNPSTTTPPITNMSPQSGEKFLISFKSLEGVNNDWLITPQLNTGHNLSLYFYAKTYSNDDESARFQVLSTDSEDEVDIDDFTVVNWSSLNPPSDWRLYTFNTYSPRTRFAIRNTSDQASALMIDNLSVYIQTNNLDDVETIPQFDILNQNYPNPFNPETSITFTIKEAGNVTIDIYNLKGQKVKTLLNEYRDVGQHKLVWNGKDDNDKQVATGLYLYRMKKGIFSSTKKMILMK